MLAYLALFSFLSFFSIKGSNRISNVFYWILFFLLTIFIGFRYEIGVDWDQYIYLIERYQDTPLSQIFENVEPGYTFLSWLGGKFKNGIYLVNVISAMTFSAGLLSYARKREYPWLSLLIAFPVLIITVAMGYTRQACAIGIELFALVEMENGKNNRAIFLTFLASAFHISILPMFVFYIKDPIKNLIKLKYLISVIVVLYLAYLIISIKFGNALVGYYLLYIKSEYSSSGAIYRIFPTLVASLLFVKNKLKFQNYYGQIANLYEKFAYLGFLFTVLILLFPSNSTFIDRIALYFTPITIFVFTSIIKLRILKIERFDFKLLMVFTYFAYSFIWLRFAIHAYAWVPYKNFLFI